MNHLFLAIGKPPLMYKSLETAVGSDPRAKVIKTRDGGAGSKLLLTGKHEGWGVKSSCSVFVECLLCAFGIKCRMWAAWRRAEVTKVYLAPCVPSARVSAHGTGVALTLPSPSVRKQVAFICYHPPSPASWRSSHGQPLNLYQARMEGVENGLFCMVWKQSSILIEDERNLQEGNVFIPRG